MPIERHSELLRLLRTAGVAQSEVDGPIVTRQGYRIPWTFYSLGATLASSDGMALGAKALLDLVERFGPCQIAAHGLTAAPLLGACIALWSCPDLANRFDCLNQLGALVSNSMGET